MASRGYSVDPNSTAISSPAWWNTLGPTQRPSPYATTSWEYLQDYDVFIEQVYVDPDILDLFDNWRDFTTPFYSYVLDGGDCFASSLLGADPLDNGLFNGEGGIYINRTFTLARVSVWDSKASSPGTLSRVEMDRGSLATNSETEDSLSIEVEGGDIDGFQLNVTGEAQLADDNPPGALLGYIDYQIIDRGVAILNWSDIGWRNDQPVRKAFSAMMNALPDCVTVVTVEDSAETFWKSLGFTKLTKGSNVLTYTV